MCRNNSRKNNVLQDLMLMKRRRVFTIICIIMIALGLSGCARPQSAALNNRMKDKSSSSTSQSNNGNDINTITPIPASDDASVQAFLDSKDKNSPTPTSKSKSDKNFGKADSTGRVGYQCDIEQDKKNFSGKVDITVGDKMYATQINDWYANFKKYEGKTVEIEGYYIGDYKPYTFVGRYGPSCTYCNGGYVSFEFYTQNDISALKSVKDWIKVIGILRQGEDKNGVFYYIEVLKLDIMNKIGKDTVTN